MSIRVCEFFVLPTVRQDDKIELVFLPQSALRFTQRAQSYFNVEFSQNLKIKFAKLCVDNALRIFCFTYSSSG
jgi:hypothetical protein